jgi:hypothetical protein
MTEEERTFMFCEECGSAKWVLCITAIIDDARPYCAECGCEM